MLGFLRQGKLGFEDEGDEVFVSRGNEVRGSGERIF